MSSLSGTATLLFQNADIFPQSQKGSAFKGKKFLLQKLIVLFKNKQHFLQGFVPQRNKQGVVSLFFSCYSN